MTARFERSTTSTFGAKIFARGDANPRLEFEEAIDPAPFLARLWALFGPPQPIDDGFAYDLRDRETGLVFSAYSGPSGPSYGGRIDEAEALRPVVAAFERLLDRTEPVECAFSATMDVEYGGATMVIGWRDGRPFRETRDARTPPESARSYEECVAIAREHESGYGAVAGWQSCLDRVLPPAPEEVDWAGTRWEDPVGFTIDDDVPSMLYVGESGSPEPIPVAEIRFDPPLPAPATLWLDAFERWKRERQRATLQ